MKLVIKSIALSAVLSSMLLASPQSDIEQLRNEVSELKKMVLELAKSNKELRSKTISTPKVQIAASSSELDELKSSVNELKSSLEGNAKSGFQLAGYASFDWADSQNANNEFTGVKFAPIFHYQYGSIFQFEGELEITTTKTGETNIELEYAAGTLFINDYMGLQVGKFMSPIGQFVQNQHPSWINKLPSTPVGFGHDGAAPTSNVGAALRGGLPKLGDIRSNYVLFVSNAPTFGLADDGDVVIEAIGTTTSSNVSKTWGGRFAVNPVGGMEIAISGATGKIAEESATGGETIARDYDVFGADFMYAVNSLNLKGEYVQQDIGENSASALEGGKWKAWYAQASYQFSSVPIEPVIRYSDYHNPETKRNQLAIGVNYLFTNNLVAKLAYEYNEDENDSGSSINDNRVLAQLAFGF